MEAVKNKLKTLHAKHQEAVKEAEECENDLAEIIEKAKAMEALAEKPTVELNEIEDKLDAAESLLTDQRSQLRTSEKVVEEKRRTCKQLENCVENDNKRVVELEKELGLIRAENTLLVEKFEKIEIELPKSEEFLDDETERVESSKERVKQLEMEATQVGNSLRSMELSEKKAAELVRNGDGKILKLEHDYKKMDEVATKLELELEKLEQESIAKDEELPKVRQKYEATKEKFDALVEEINTFLV